MFKLLISALTLLSTLLAMSFTAEPALAERRVALVIGNSSYKNPNLTLPNPKNDADDIAVMLRSLGFDVVLATDTDKRALDLAMQQFARKVTDADAALFFYAGHAMQYQGKNYLMPTDAELEDDISLRYQMIAIDDVRAALDRSNGVKIMILDACRNNPLADRLARNMGNLNRNIGPTRGLARVEKTQGMVVAYATAADDVAQDGTGRNSPFTSALLNRIQEPGVEVEIMFRRVTADVNTQTGGRQRPETYISLLSEYYLNQNDKVQWEKLKDSGNVAALKDFVGKYPSSTYAMQAQTQIAALDQTDRDQQAKSQNAQRESDQIRNRLEALERDRASQAADQLARADAARKADVARKADEACKRDEDRLTSLQLGEGNAREQLIRLERELTCDRLRPLVLAAIAGQAQDVARPRISMPVVVEPLADTPELIRAAQSELRRIGCFDGKDDGKLGDNTRSSLKRYLTRRGQPADQIKVSETLVAELKAADKGVCPLECKRGEVAQNGRCVAEERVATPRKAKQQVKKSAKSERSVEPRRRVVRDDEPKRDNRKANAPVNNSPPSGPAISPMIGIGGIVPMGMGLGRY
jgi:uncharacterized caspase-like protein